MSGKLDGAVAVVTGAARGMGLAQAKLFVEEGASVVLADVLVEDGRAMADELGAAARFERLDVTSPEEWSEVIERTEAAFGPITALANTAGVISWSGLKSATWEDYLRVVAVNQHGVFLGMRAVIDSMSRAGGGSIVNMSSVAGMTGGPAFAYCASKWAIRGMTKSAAVALAGDKIRVNSVHPGMVATPMMSEIQAPSGKLLIEDPDNIPLGRCAEPEEIARLVLFLACEDSSFVTGAEYVIDGGMLASAGLGFRPAH